MQKARIYQIFYSEQTRRNLDAGFIPLDNSNRRPDWCEYWPIRNYLIDEPLDSDTYYGFLSPKFRSKTGLMAADVHRFLNDSADAAPDIVTFSPFFDAAALFPNIFLQGADSHLEVWPAFVESARLLVPGIDLDTLVMDSTNTVFCNYFLAKPPFWRHWLSKAERIFQIAEQSNTPFAQALNQTTNHSSGPTAVKVFVIERLLSLILATEPQWRVKSFNPMCLPLNYPGADWIGEQLIMLDALKMAAVATGRSEYMQVFASLKTRTVK